MNPTYNNTTKQLTYTISFDYNLPVFQLPLAFDLDLDPLVEISTATQVNFDVSTSFDFTIRPGSERPQRRAHRDEFGAREWSHFGRCPVYVARGRTGAVPVTLLKTATDANASIDDLVVDLNAALAAAGLAGQVVAARDATDSSRLTLKTINIGPIVSLSLLANPLSPAVTELKFENGHLAFETMFDDVFFEDTSISAAAQRSDARCRRLGRVRWVCRREHRQWHKQRQHFGVIRPDRSDDAHAGRMCVSGRTA